MFYSELFYKKITAFCYNLSDIYTEKWVVFHKIFKFVKVKIHKSLKKKMLKFYPYYTAELLISLLNSLTINAPHEKFVFSLHL